MTDDLMYYGKGLATQSWAVNKQVAVIIVEDLELLRVEWRKPAWIGACVVDESGVIYLYEHGQNYLTPRNMTSGTLELSKDDPGISEMIGSWQNGKTYELRLRVKQVATDETKTAFEVIEAEDLVEGEMESEEEPAQKKNGKPALIIALSKK